MDIYKEIILSEKKNSTFIISFSEYSLNAQPSTIKAPMPPHSGRSLVFHNESYTLI